MASAVPAPPARSARRRFRAGQQGLAVRLGGGVGRRSGAEVFVFVQLVNLGGVADAFVEAEQPGDIISVDAGWDDAVRTECANGFCPDGVRLLILTGCFERAGVEFGGTGIIGPSGVGGAEDVDGILWAAHFVKDMAEIRPMDA